MRVFAVSELCASEFDHNISDDDDKINEEETRREESSSETAGS
jgi:hypothetical protein